MFSYQITTPLKIKWTFQTIIKNFLSKTTAELLNLLRLGPPTADLSKTNYETIPVSTQRILKRHKYYLNDQAY